MAGAEQPLRLAKAYGFGRYLKKRRGGCGGSLTVTLSVVAVVVLYAGTDSN
jgi:hypothetical protein